MRRTRSAESRVGRFRLGRASILAVLAVAAQVGCTREFYREWANMDVSETIFEKSRDPRWRLDVFSIEPPALSRFADPYDPEVPPAPPDDAAAEALSPVPQWPDNRLLIPVEGTGYLDLMEYWQRQDDGKREFEPGAAGSQPSGYGSQPRGSGNQPAPPPGGTPRPPDSGSPFAPPPALPPVAPPAPNRPPAGPDMRGPQAGTPGENPGGTATPAQTVIRMQDAPLPQPAGSSAARGEVADQSVTNPGTNVTGSTPISLTKSTSPAATTQIPPPKPGGDRAFSPRRSERAISIPPPRSGASISIQPPGPAQSASIPPPRPGSAFAFVEPLRVKIVNDRSVSQATFSSSAASAQPSPNQGAAAQPEPQPPPAGNMDQQVPRLQPRAPVGNEQPRPGGLEPSAPSVELTPRQLEEIGTLQPGGAEAKGLAEILVAVVPSMDEAEMAGLPRGFKAYRLGMAHCWLLSLMNSRFYQYNLEALYLAALPVTLQRFYFEPQFYAGMSPLTSVPQTPGVNGVSVGSSTPGVNTVNSFNYATRFSPTGQISTLNLGTVAGFGKLFSSGGQLLMGFANEVAFNFLGKNPQQPTVLSALPISFVQPLLRGGGRAVTLEPLTSAERTLLYQVRLFALFRQEFFVVTLTAGTVQNFGNTFALAGFSAGISGNVDPVVGFIPAVQNIAEVEIDRRNVQFYENLYRLYTELIQGEASGLTPLQVDQVLSSLISARQTLFGDKITYRNSLDQFKMQMGLPPDTPIVLDMHLFQPFFEVFDGVDRWQKDPKRSMDQLPTIISKFPVLEDIDVEGRSVLGLYRNYDAERRIFKAEDEDPLEDELQAAVRIALEYRLDLMNQRSTPSKTSKNG